MAYREAPVEALKCPRCKKVLPPLAIAACTCGTWVSALAATLALTEVDRRPDPATRWWKVRPPCPLCGDQMVLCGDEPGHLVGCEGHGYWVDADARAHTGLAVPVDPAALEQLSESDEAIARAQSEREAAEAARARARAEKLDAEAAIGSVMSIPLSPPPPSPHAPPPRVDHSPAALARERREAYARTHTERIDALEDANAELTKRVKYLEDQVRALLAARRQT